MNTFKKTLVGIGAVSVALVAMATVTTVNKTSEFATSYGADTVNYTGEEESSAEVTHSGAIAFETTAKASATTLSVAEGKTLTLSGALTGASGSKNVTGAFIKTGAGELVFDNSANAKKIYFNGTTSHIYGGQDNSLKWNDAGSATAGFGNFNVVAGKVTVPAGQYVYGYNTLVGPHTAAASQMATMDVSGEFDAANLFILGYYSKAPDGGTYKATIGNGGKLTTGEFWMNYDNSASAAYCDDGKSEIEIDGGTATLTAKGYYATGNRGYATIKVCNKGVLDYKRAEGGAFGSTYGAYGMDAPAKAKSVAYDISGASVFKATAVGGSDKGTVTISGDSTNMVDRTMRACYSAKQGFATVTFDSATLMAYTPTIVSDWYAYASNVVIGTGGLTVTSDVGAMLGGHLQKAEGESVGMITKRGEGEIAFPAGAADINVVKGVAAFSLDNDGVGDQNGRITAEEGTKVRIAGNNALGDMTLVAGPQENVFMPTQPTVDEFAKSWEVVHAAKVRRDGWICLNNPSAGTTNGVGAIWNKTQMDLTKSFTITFDYFATCTLTGSGTYPAYGFAAGWQKVGGYKGSAIAAHGKTSRNCGWGDDWTSSFAFSQDAADGCTLHYTEAGGFVGAKTASGGEGDYKNTQAAKVNNYGKRLAPLHMKIEYDATNHKAKFTTTQPDGTKPNTLEVDVDLSTEVANAAYFGFTGSTTISESQTVGGLGGHYVNNIRIAYAGDSVTPVTTAVGGKVEIAAGRTFNATLEQDDVQKGWVLDSVACAGDATVNVSGSADATLTAKSVTGADALTKTGTGAFGVTAGSAIANSIAVNAGSLAVTRINPYTEPLAQTAANWQVQTNLGGLAYTLKNRPKDFPERYSQFVNNGFAIGRSSNANVRDNARFDSRTRIKVNTDWEITYGLKTEYYDVNHNAGFYGVCFHNDSQAPNGVALSDSGEAQPNFCHGIGNCAAIVWGAANAGGSNGYGNKVAVATGSAILKTSSSDWRETSPVIMGHKRGDSENGNFETNCTVKLSYAASTKTLTIYMKQPKWEVGATDPTYSEKTIVFENFDIPTAVGGDYAYISFGANTTQAWYGLLTTITDFAYVDKSATFEAAATVSVGANATLVYGGDTSGSTVEAKLATTLNAADGATIKIASGATIGADTLVAGGKLVIDGGIYKFTSAGAVSGLKRLYLNNGAKVHIPEGVTIKLSRLYIDGVRQDTVPADTVVGGGELDISSVGIMIFLE